MSKANIPIFVPHRGCKNSCVFCNQNRITGKTDDMTPEKAEKTIEKWLEFIEGEAEIAFFGGSFTGIEKEEQNALLEVADSFVDGKKITGIRLSTRPDYIDEKIIENLLRYHINTIELGAQSTDAEVLRLSRRGHTPEDIEKASHLIKQSGIDLGLQMMTGLPGANNEKDIKTSKDFISLGPSQVRIYPTVVLRDTFLCELYERGEYTTQTISEAAELVACLIENFEKAKIRVIRTGLQSSESLEKGYVAGPYHPSFGEIAQSRLILKRIEAFYEGKSPSVISINCEEKYKSRLYGQKRENIKKIESLFSCPVRVFTEDVGKGILIDNEVIYK